MNSHAVSKLWALMHSPGLILMVALGAMISSIAAPAQNTFQVDAQHSVARLSLGSGQNALEIGLRNMTNTDPLGPRFRLTLVRPSRS